MVIKLFTKFKGICSGLFSKSVAGEKISTKITVNLLNKLFTAHNLENRHSFESQPEPVKCLIHSKGFRTMVLENALKGLG